MSNETKLFDHEQVLKTSLFLRSLDGQTIGRYCMCGCGRHIFGRQNKKFFNDNHRTRYYIRDHRSEKNHLRASINLDVILDPFPHRMIHIYLKKGIMEKVRITPDNKELWALLDHIDNFRNQDSQKVLTKDINSKTKSKQLVEVIKVA